MLETSKPKLDVQIIMKEIKKEIDLERPSSAYNSAKISLSQLEYIEALISNAEFYAETPTKWPDKLSFFPFSFNKIQSFILKVYSFIFKKQKVVNNSIAQALKANLAINRQLLEQINGLANTIEKLEKKSQIQEGVLARYRQNIDQINRATETGRDFAKRLNNIEQYSLSNDVYIKNDLNQQKRLLSTLSEKLNGNYSDLASKKTINYRPEDKHLLDAFYIALEDRFRGSREEIIEKLKVYLPLIQEANNNTKEKQLLDAGCGRGEWLELLQNEGYQVRGIDINRVAIEQCQERGLNVMEADVIQHLKTLPEQSLGGVTGFHIIEHLPFETLLELFSETVRVLKKGGIAIFETPNPQNILVASYKFYIDPTHLHPLPSELIKFVAELQGLTKVQILNLNPYPKDLFLKNSEVAARFNAHFYSAQDYSVIGYKA